MVRREIIQLRTFKIHDSDDARLVNHRYGQLRAGLSVDHAVARIQRNIRDDNRTALLRGGTDDALVFGHHGFFLHPLAEFHGDAMAENGGCLVVEQDAEDLVIDQALGQLRRPAQHLLYLQRRAGFAADFVEQQKSLGLFLGVFKKARVFDGRADAAADEREQHLLVRREVIELAAFDIEDSDHSTAHDQRYGKLGAHFVDRGQIARIFRDVTDTDGLACGDGGADNAVAHGDAPMLDDFLAMPDCKAHIKVVGSELGQKHGEDLEVDELADLLRSAGQHLV